MKRRTNQTWQPVAGHSVGGSTAHKSLLRLARISRWRAAADPLTPSLTYSPTFPLSHFLPCGTTGETHCPALAAAPPRWVSMRTTTILLLALAISCLHASGAEKRAVTHFRKDVQPILKQYCYDCHGDGMSK